MELNMNKFTADCFEPVCVRRIRQDGSADCVIPDSMPDAVEIVSVSGTALIRSKDVGEGAASLELNVAASAAFVPEGGGGLCCVELNIPVSVRIDDPAVNSECVCTADFRLVALEGKLLNPRKILVKADVLADVRCWSETRLELAGGAEDGGCCLNTLCEDVAVTGVKCVSEKTFVLTDEYVIGADRPAAQEIIGQSARISVDDLKIAGTKLIIKGTVSSSLLMSAVGGGETALEFVSPFTQICETGAQCADAVCTASVVLSGAYFELLRESEGRTVTAEIHAVAQYVCRDRMTVNVLADAYSNRYDLDVKRSERVFKNAEREATLRCNLEGTLETAGEARTVIRSDAFVGTPEISGSVVRVPVTVAVLYADADGARRSQKKRLTAEFDCPCSENETAETVSVTVGELFAIASGRSVELRATAEARILVTSERRMEYVSAIERSEERRRETSALPSAVLVRVSGRGGLWDAAKRHCSTVEAIRRVNALEPDYEPQGERLLVPKAAV